MSWLDRQSFLGPDSDAVLKASKVGVVGLGGGGSHVAQQMAHVGVGHFVLLDDDAIDDTNLNRLVGGRWSDVEAATPKVEIARRLVLSVNPAAVVECPKALWQAESERLKACDVIIGGLDSVRAKQELEGFCRRFLIPYIDMGMDVHVTDEGHLIAGQVVLSMPGKPCLRCLSVVRDDALEAEGRNYGAAGGKPQVVWPNGVLASTAVGLFMQLVTPWHTRPIDSIYLEYDGNLHRVVPRQGFERALTRECPHYPAEERGDPSFDIRRWRSYSDEVVTEIMEAPLSQNLRRRLRKLFGKS